METTDNKQPSAFVVPFRDVDMRGEMHRAAYILRAEEAVAAFWRMRPSPEGDPHFSVTKVSCTLTKILRLGDRVTMSVRVSKIGVKFAAFAVRMERDAELAAEAEIVWTASDADSGALLPLSEELRDWLYQYLD